MKTSIDDLAIFGGRPEFTTSLHVGRPNLGERSGMLDRIGAALDRRWLTNDGPFLQEFESRVAKLLGVDHCIAVSNGTAALGFAVRATGMHGEVIVPSFTFIGTVHALLWQGITPIFCDVDPATHNLDPNRVVELITPRTTGIVGVHLWGRPCAVDRLQEIAMTHRLQLIFDAAHAFGCSDGGRMIGRFGNAEVFSFHATKCVNTCEGGAIATNDPEIAERVRRFRNFGFTDYDAVSGLGVNGKLNEISAAIGLSSLDAMDEFICANQRNYRQYRPELTGLAGLTVVPHDNPGPQNYHYIVVELDTARAGLSRDELIGILWQENILARRYFFPGCHRSKPYDQMFPRVGARLPHTERLCSQVFCLPNGQTVGAQEIDRICAIIRFALAHASAIISRMSVRQGSF